MPESRLDRLVLLVGILALAGLVALIVPEWRAYTSAGDSSPRASAPPLPPVALPSPSEVALPPPSEPLTTEVSPSARSVPPGSHSGTTATPSSLEAEAAEPPVATLRLRAARGDCWVEARAGSASGRQLYFGMLPQGQELVLSGRAVWLRLGAPQNLDGWIGTKPVRSLPSAASTVVATPAGVRTVALG